jgi:hypothetical protein
MDSGRLEKANMTRLLVVIGVLCATPAFAQTYVAAVVGADLTKSYQSTTNGTTFPDGDGEVMSWGLRVGTALGSRWGVELEFNRPDELEMQNGPVIYAQPLSAASAISWTSTAAGGVIDVSPTIFPAPEIRIDQRATTWNASAWVGKPLGARADLVVLGGLGFSRVVQNSEYVIGGPPQLVARIPLAQRSYRTRTASYGVGPLVGVEARIHMSERLQLTPGVRVQSLGNDLTQGLVLRPSIALGWMF